MRLPPDPSSWLRHPVTREVALGHVLDIERMEAGLGISRPTTRRQRFEDWMREHFRPGDDLWWYNTGGETWADMMGECGYAIVRGEEAVEFFTIAEN